MGKVFRRHRITERQISTLQQKVANYTDYCGKREGHQGRLTPG